MEEAMAKTGRVRSSEEQLKTRLENAGFVDIQVRTVKQPIGPWPKEKYGTLDCREVVLRIEKRVLIWCKTTLIPCKNDFAYHAV
jgi:hypothetical protein